MPRGLSRAAFLNTYTLYARHDARIHGDSFLEPVEDLVRCVLEARVGLVQLAGRLGGELAELVTVGDVGESSKNKI
jgi:hypothetical protein